MYFFNFSATQYPLKGRRTFNKLPPLLHDFRFMLKVCILVAKFLYNLECLSVKKRKYGNVRFLYVDIEDVGLIFLCEDFSDLL